MQLCSFIEAFFKSLIAVCVSSTVAVKNRIVAFKSHITARRHPLTNRRATRNFRFRRPVAMILSLVMALQLLMVFASATSGTTSKPDPWRDGPRDLYFYDGMMGGGEHWPKGHVTVSNHEVTVEVEEGASLLGYVVPAGKYNMKELAQKYAMTIWLTEERACLALSLAKGEPFMDEPVPVKLDGKPTNVELDGAYMHINPEQLGKLNLPVAVVTTAGYLDLSYVADSLGHGAFCTDDYVEDSNSWNLIYNLRYATAIEKVAVDNVSSEVNGVWYEISGSKVTIRESWAFAGHYWDQDMVPENVKRYYDVVRYDDSTDIQDIAVWYSTNGEEPVSVRHNGFEIAWGTNPRQAFLFRGSRGTVTYISSTLLVDMSGGYADKGYIRNSDGPDTAWYERHDGSKIKFYVGTSLCDFNGATKDVLENIGIQNGTTIVPIRSAELFGLEISWEGRNASGMGVVSARNLMHAFGG